MKIITLLENHPDKANPALKSEHGVSFYVENQGHMIMSDVGKSGLFAKNAKRLGVDLTRVEALAISHHHHDHGGGLGRFFMENQKAIVYLRVSPEDADYIAENPSQPPRVIGLDRGLLQDKAERIVNVSEKTEVLPGFHLLKDIPSEHPKPGRDTRMKIRQAGHKRVDTFEHEMVTVLEGDSGLVILTGCAHNGVMNMVVATQKAFPEKSLQAVIGGFHLHRESDDDVRKVGEALLDADVPAVYTGHCTGDHAMDVLAEVLGDRLKRLCTGMVIEF